MAIAGVLLPAAGYGQISLASAAGLALRNSPRVKMAEDDVRRAAGGLSETKDAYMPRLSATGGLGDAYGITLTIPTIFTASAQSLVFSYAQRDYIRAARLDLQASTLTLTDVREQVEEDVATTYVGLDHALELRTALLEQNALALRLESIVRQRLAAGLESEQELRVSSRGALQMKLRVLEAEDEIASLQEHLGQMMGVPGDGLMTVTASIPASAPRHPALGSTFTYVDPPALLSAEANARARQERAFADSRYTWRPQVNFEAQYGRISPIVDVTSYYNIQGNYNTLSAGVVILLPFLDAGHKARAQQTAADAAHAAHDVARMRGQIVEDRLRLRHGLAEMEIRTQLAEIEQTMAQDQLKALLLELKTGGYAGPPRTPKEEVNLRMRERQTYIDFLGAKLEMRRSQIFLLRQTGELGQWITSGTQ